MTYSATQHAGYLSGRHFRLVQQARFNLRRSCPIRCPTIHVFMDHRYALEYLRGWNDMHQDIAAEKQLPDEAELRRRKMAAHRSAKSEGIESAA